MEQTYTIPEQHKGAKVMAGFYAMCKPPCGHPSVRVLLSVNTRELLCEACGKKADVTVTLVEQGGGKVTVRPRQDGAVPVQPPAV